MDTINNTYSLYKPLSYLKLIVEDAAIENICHIKCERHYHENIKEWGVEINEYLTTSIEDKDNFILYIDLINELKEYCLKIIQTEWGDTDGYQTHIDFITLFINNFETEQPIRIKALGLPFRHIISFDMQDLILYMKFKNELKFWNRYQFIINHTEFLLDYLNQKKEYSKLY